ncbi:MAG: hypothetical protein K2P81_15220 [Bacteriovoracaceae bacterium]|nr:hypothetical protein [Bacteriovoracaceae bacterium]
MLKMNIALLTFIFATHAFAGNEVIRVNGSAQGGGTSSKVANNAAVSGSGQSGFLFGMFTTTGNSSNNSKNYMQTRLNHQATLDSSGGSLSTTVSVRGEGTGTATGAGNGGDNSTDISSGSIEHAQSGEQYILKTTISNSSEQDRCFGIERGNLPEEFRKIVDSTCPNVLSKDYCGCLISLVANKSPLGEKIKNDYPKAKKNMMAVNYRSLLKRWSEAYIDNIGVMLSNKAMTIENDNVCSPSKMLESVIRSMSDRINCKGDPEAFGIAAQSLINTSSKLDANGIDFTKIPINSFLKGMMNGAKSRNIVVAPSGKVEAFNCLDEGQAAVLSLLPKFFEKTGNIKTPSLDGESRSERVGLNNSINITNRWIKKIEAESAQKTDGNFSAEMIIKNNEGFSKVLKLFPGLELLITTLSYPRPCETEADRLKRLNSLKETLSKINKFSTQLSEPKLNSPKMSNRDLIRKINSYSEDVKELVEKQSTEYVDDIKDVSEGRCGLLQHDLTLIACANDTLLDDRAQVLSAFGDAERDRSLGGIENAQNCKSDKEIALQCMSYNYVTCKKQSEIKSERVIDLLGNLQILKGRSGESIQSRVADSYWRNDVEDSIIGDVCKNYTAFLKEQKCDVSESAAQACLSNQEENGLTSKAYISWLKKNDLDDTDGGIEAAQSSTSNPVPVLDEKGTLASSNSHSQNQILAGIQSSIEGSKSPVDSSFGAQFLKAATIGSAASSGSAQMTNSQVASYITPTQTIPQQIANKDAAIAAKETEITEKVNDSKSLQDPVLKSAAEEELKALRAELAALKKERETLASSQQEAESQVADNAGANKNNNQPNRSPASVTGSTSGSSFSVGSSGSSTSGGSSGGGSTSGINSGFGNTGSSLGGSSSGPTTVQAALSSLGSSSSALLEANQLKLTVGGQEVAAQNVTTLQIPAGASREAIQKVIQDNQSKLKFVDGVALVELIGADKKPIYYQVKKQGEGFELIVVKEDIPTQVRKWSASYANFLKKIQTIRGPSGQSTEGRP